MDLYLLNNGSDCAILKGKIIALAPFLRATWQLLILFDVFGC